MLVLSRKVGEKIWIGPDICLTVVQVDRGKVRLGIDAPRSVNVRRSEISLDLAPTSDEPVLVSCP